MNERAMQQAAATSLEHIQKVAERFQVERGLGAELETYAPYRYRGSIEGAPKLLLDDFSAIPFLDDIAGVAEYQHRARLRAGSGDVFASVTPPTPGYERYCRNVLGLGEAHCLLAEPVAGDLEVALALCHGESFAALKQVAASEGALVVHPYMGIESVWQLARSLADETDAEVRVLAPPPPVLWIANDKAAFEDLVASVLDRSWLVESTRSKRPEELARMLLGLAERHRLVALKRLRCASAMGNRVFEAAALLRSGLSACRKEVEAFLQHTQWQGDEEVLAVAWEETDISPSTQWWIPPVGEGEPRLDGIYEQLLEGEHKIFVGSCPSRLPEPVHRRMRTAGAAVVKVLQLLGYVGRCSFDHLVIGDPSSDFRVLFTECNGRWGGTSTPMSLVDRMIEGERPPYRAQDFVHPGLVGTSFEQVLERLASELYRADTGNGRYVFYNVGPVQGHGKLDVIALGSDQAEADDALKHRLPALLGLE